MSRANMSDDGPFDPRGVSNLLLDEADRLDIEITNLSLQKLLFFCHGLSLVEQGGPLVTGYFEAWDHGPVHPLVYRSFKTAGRSPISFRADSVDALTGTTKPLPKVTNPLVLSLIWKVLSGYARSSLSILLDISHARGGPWHFVMAKSEYSPVLGMRITDDVILERFKRQVVGVGDHDSSEGKNEAPEDIRDHVSAERNQA